MYFLNKKFISIVYKILKYKIKVLTMMSLVNKYSLLSEIKQENINENKSESDSESISEANK